MHADETFKCPMMKTLGATQEFALLHNEEEKLSERILNVLQYICGAAVSSKFIWRHR